MVGLHFGNYGSKLVHFRAQRNIFYIEKTLVRVILDIVNTTYVVCFRVIHTIKNQAKLEYFKNVKYYFVFFQTHQFSPIFALV